MSGVPGVRPDDRFQLLERRAGFRGRFIGVSVDRVVLPGSVEMSQEVLHLPTSVCVVPLLEMDDGEPLLVLVEQFRCALRGYIHELPAGIVDAGEEPRDAAARELEEETGYHAASLIPLASLCPLPGTSDHRMHFFLAEQLTAGRPRLEATECLTVKRLPFASLARSVLARGDADGDAGSEVIVDAKTHLGILHVAMLRGLSGGA